MKALSSIRRVTTTRAITCRKRLKDENIDQRYLCNDRRMKGRDINEKKRVRALSFFIFRRVILTLRALLFFGVNNAYLVKE